MSSMTIFIIIISYKLQYYTAPVSSQYPDTAFLTKVVYNNTLRVCCKCAIICILRSNSSAVVTGGFVVATEEILRQLSAREFYPHRENERHQPSELPSSDAAGVEMACFILISQTRNVCSAVYDYMLCMLAIVVGCDIISVSSLSQDHETSLRSQNAHYKWTAA